MPRVAVVTDSTSCLTETELRDGGLRVVDLDVVMDGRAHSESSLTTTEVAAALRARRHVSTSSPAPTRFEQAYAAAVHAGAEQIVSVHLSGRASGTLNVARLVAQDSEVPVRVVDTAQLARATGVSALAAARAALAGQDVDAVEAVARDTAAACRTVFCVDDLEHLRRGGRLSATATLVGSALSVKPLLVVRGGLVEVLEKVRTTTRARARLVSRVQSALADIDGPVRLWVHHVDALAQAEDLAEQVREHVGRVPVQVLEASPVIAAHVGPGALGFVLGPDTPA